MLYGSLLLCLGAFAASVSALTLQKDSEDFDPRRVMFIAKEDCPGQEAIEVLRERMLERYPCLTTKRHGRIHSVAGYKRVYFGMHHDYDDIACVKEVDDDEEWEAQCVEAYFEPLAYLNHWDVGKKVVGDTGETCVSESVTANLWSLDVLDGVDDGQYLHAEYNDPGVEFIVLDTGVEKTHPEFTFNEVEVIDGPIINSEYDHGTHVAGTMSGATVGVTRKFKIWNYPVCRNSDGSCSWEHIEKGYENAIAHMNLNPGVRYVINYSVGGRKSVLKARDYDDWGQRIQDAGGVWVTSAGNSAADACGYAPAYSSFAVTVGAYDNQFLPSYFSNFGDCVDVWGPGSYIYSSLPGNSYGFASGTSMASPNMAGVTATIVADNPEITTDGVKAALLSNAVTLADCPEGYGTCQAPYQSCSTGENKGGKQKSLLEKVLEKVQNNHD